MNRLIAALLVLIAGVAGNAVAATEIPAGKWSFVFTDAKGHADRPIRVYTYRPQKCDAKCPLVIVLHGLSRNASNYRDYWESAADRYNLVIAAPEFSQRYWPKAAAYNLGELASTADREKWTFSAVEHLFDEVRDGRDRYVLYGHSAGGQFVHRMAIFLPDNRASLMVAANPGWYTMPEWRKDKIKFTFPYSLVESRAGEAELRKALQRRFVLMLGEKDTDPEDESLRKDDGAKAQGAGRVDRGENFFKASTAAAGELGVKFAWELVEVPDTAHQGAAMSRFAADTLFGKK